MRLYSRGDGGDAALCGLCVGEDIRGYGRMGGETRRDYVLLSGVGNDEGSVDKKSVGGRTYETTHGNSLV